MTYEVLIRHTVQIPYGIGIEQRIEERRVEARSEEEAFLKIKHTSDDFIACIDSFNHGGLEPYSVETGDPEFFTNVQRPALRACGTERRAG